MASTYKTGITNQSTQTWNLPSTGLISTVTSSSVTLSPVGTPASQGYTTLYYTTSDINFDNGTDFYTLLGDGLKSVSVGTGGNLQVNVSIYDSSSAIPTSYSSTPNSTNNTPAPSSVLLIVPSQGLAYTYLPGQSLQQVTYSTYVKNVSLSTTTTATQAVSSVTHSPYLWLYIVLFVLFIIVLVVVGYKLKNKFDKNRI